MNNRIKSPTLLIKSHLRFYLELQCYLTNIHKTVKISSVFAKAIIISNLTVWNLASKSKIFQ